MPARCGKPAEQRVAAFLFGKMKALRIELPREAFDVLGREGERSQLAPLSDLDIFVKGHQRCVRTAPLAPADDDRRDHFAQRLARGVAGHAPEGHDARFGTAVRHPRFRHIDIERQVVAGTQRRHPFQFVDPGRAERGGLADERIEHHPHHQRAEMPARTRKVPSAWSCWRPPRRDASAADRIRRQTPESPRA